MAILITSTITVTTESNLFDIFDTCAKTYAACRVHRLKAVCKYCGANNIISAS